MRKVFVDQAFALLVHLPFFIYVYLYKTYSHTVAIRNDTQGLSSCHDSSPTLMLPYRLLLHALYLSFCIAVLICGAL